MAPEHGISASSYELRPSRNQGDLDDDAVYLARIGKQQVLKRGPAGLIYGGFFLIWVGILSVFVVIGELASIAPTAGGQYHWVYLLAPPSYRKILSYVTGTHPYPPCIRSNMREMWHANEGLLSGCTTCIGWLAATATTSLFCSSLVQALIVLNNDTYIPTRWQGTLLLRATIFVAITVNLAASPILPKLEGLILVIHIAGFFGILIPLLYLGPKASSKDVFTTFVNGGGWPTNGLSFFIGLAGNSVAFLGSDGAVHMSKEIKNARTNVPKAIISGIMINGLLGFGMLLAVLYCAGDLTVAFASPTNFPFIEILTSATGSRGGTSAMVSVIVIIAFVATIGSLTTTSRQLWAFARDRGVPGWRSLSKIDERSKIPIWAIVVVSIIPCLLSLINIGSDTIFNDFLSLVLAGFFTSYEIPAILLLYHRCKGSIRPLSDDSNHSDMPTEKLSWGPWRLSGAWGIANNIFACIFFSFFFAFLDCHSPNHEL
ncbi:hypothetical protein OCU04_009438 [Sclerotinia nivalis]|uniref:Amino acid transporter n=1 Tax=Sclerotinia nivalis TaxID=352851 RepID=A0A9X0AF59_9HELO|nr:hypothetical protein OCU04_009438 [Sclerotinia nivalis]